MDVDPQDSAHDYNVVTQDNFWLTSNLVNRTYENVYDILPDIKQEIVMMEPDIFHMITFVGPRWRDEELKKMFKTQQKILKRMRKNCIKNFRKHHPEWHEKKAIWMTSNDSGLDYKSGKVYDSKASRVSLVTLRYFVKKQSSGVQTRSKDKKFRELKLYIFDLFHQPLTEKVEAFRRITNWMLIPIQFFLINLIQADQITVDSNINCLSPKQVYFHPPQTNGIDCGLYCSAALENFYTFIADYANEKNQMHQIVTGGNQNDLIKKRPSQTARQQKLC